MNTPSGRPKVTETPLASTPLGQDLPAATIPDHELLYRIGGGSYGEVWLSRNALGAFRAVKIIHRKSFEDRRPFEREFNGLLKFEPISRSHEGLVDILQVGRQEDYFYYVMELADDVNAQLNARPHPGPLPRGEGGIASAQGEVGRSRIAGRREKTVPSPGGGGQGEGGSKSPRQSENFDLSTYGAKTLRALIRPDHQPSTPDSQPSPRRLPVEQCVEIGLALTSALAHLHKHGLVHRDVKPSNIIFVQGAPKLADIGLVTEADTTLSYVGTEGYIPPEGPGAAQADIFSLGKVLYEISTGQDRRQFPDLPPDLKEWPDQAPLLELNEVLVKACARDASLRYQSCEEMHADLALLQRGHSVKRRRAFQHWLVITKKATLVLSLFAVIVAAVVLFRQRPSDPYLRSPIPGVDKLVEQGNSIAEGRSAERLRTALEKYNEAIQLDPNFVPARFGVFTALMYRGAAERGASEEDRRELRAIAKKLMDMAPNLAESRAASAMINWVDWQFPEALAEAQLATQKQAASKQGEVSAHNYYGWFLLESGKPDAALAQYRLAEEKSPSGPIIHHHLGHPYFVKRDFEQALKHYRESLKLEGRQGIAHYLIGRVYVEQTNFMAAIQEFEEGEKMDGKYNSERKVFYDELREAVQQRGAEGYWRKRLDIAFEKPELDLYYIATLHARLGNKKEAYRYLREACDKKDFDQGLLFDLCWDHNDPEFIAIAKYIRLLQ